MLFLLALDGATFDLLTPWMNAGKLPNLANLVKSGVQGRLASTLPPVTAPAWATFMTGKPPAGHGIHDFFRHQGHGRTQIVNSTHIQARLFWEYLSAAGLQVGILNVPLTFPPRPVNGYVIPGLLSPDQGETTYPPRFWQPYAGQLGRYRLTPDFLYRPDNVADFIQELHQITERQLAYARRISQDHPVDFFMLHLLATDIAQHKLWRYMDRQHPWHDPQQAGDFGDAILHLYQRIDRALADLMARLPAGSSVIVISDHGFGPQWGTVNLNMVLVDAGLLRLKSGFGLHLRRMAWQRKGSTQLAQQMLLREKLMDFDDVDWSQTRAFSLGHLGQIYVNLEGRESQGVVSPEAYAQVCREVAAVLANLHDPDTGRLLPVEIIPATPDGTGPPPAGPDLHVKIDDYHYPAYPLFAGDGRAITAQRLGDSGNHREHGIFIAAGPGIKAGHALSGAQLVDLAPTLLHLLGQPVPTDMAGKVLQDMFVQPRPVAFGPPLPSVAGAEGLTAIEEETVAARLRDLGYLDTV